MYRPLFSACPAASRCYSESVQKEKTKILYVITKSDFGGAQRYVYDLATHISKGTYDVIVAFGGEGVLKEKLETAKVQTLSLSSLERDVSIFKEVRSFIALIKILRKEKPDIVHLNSSKAGALGALAVRFAGVLDFLNPQRPTLSPHSVFTAHGWPFKEERPFTERFLIGFASWLTVLFAHHTIVVSEDDRERALWMPFVQEKISVIHNGIEPPLLLSREEARMALTERMEHPPHPETLWIGTIAELHRNKGLSYALRALKEIHSKYNVFYVIIGEGEEREHLEKLSVMLGVSERVAFVGHMNNAASYLHAFDMFLLPSVKEGLPYTLLEAGYAARPSIGTAIGGIGEIITDMKDGILIQPRKPSEIAGALELLIDDPTRRDIFGTALREKVEKEFTLARMLRETVALYKDVHPSVE